MLGTIVNTLAIILGGLIGLTFRRGIPEKFKVTIMQAISLAVILIGLKAALKTDAILLVIFSLAIGSFIGELLRIEDRLEQLGLFFESKLTMFDGGIAKGFVAASLVFCVGSMAVVGALESGLTNSHQTLFAKSILDGVSSIVFASTMGFGVVLSSLSVLIYQGVITLAATLLSQVLVPAVVDQISSVGGLLITAIGINLLEMQRLRIGNMLPALAIPLLYYLVATQR